MPKSTLEIAKSHIEAFFSGCDRRVWTVDQLETALAEMREEWKLAHRITLQAFLDFLSTETPFIETVLAFPSRVVVRYWWGKPTDYELAMSLHHIGYFSHHTAMYFHGLTSDEPAVIYVNSEQPAKGARPGFLKQSGIDAAFKHPVRISNNRAQYEGKTICVLNGKNTGQLGVITRKHPVHGPIRVANLARTLIDIVVRPAYSGGILEVLNGYRKATGKIEAQELINILEGLQHAYPYHQSIGFLLEKSGAWDEATIALFRNMEMKHDFYLDYQMSDSKFSEAWRVYYPACLDDA